MIKETSDYSIFKKFDYNRILDESNVRKIMESLNIKNLFKYRPILVDSSLRIIDGQHRLEAAKRLSIPIFYEIKDDFSKEDIILLNSNTKNWTRQDYLNYYVNNNVEEYIKLKQFMDRNKLSLEHAITILGGRRDTRYAFDFRNGGYQFPDLDQVVNSEKILDQAKQIIEFIVPKLTGTNRYINGTMFLRSLFIFLNIKSVDFDVFINKLNHRLDLLRPCGRILMQVNLFKKIYNWNNRNPISLEDDYNEVDS